MSLWQCLQKLPSILSESYLIRQCLKIKFLFTGQVGSVWDKVDSLVGDVNKVHIDISPN
mgnify:FL=1|jgi:hypothetical protein